MRAEKNWGERYDFYRITAGRVGFRARFIEEYEYGEVVVRLENGTEVGRGSLSFGGFFECTIQTVFNGRHLAKGENVFNAIYVRASQDGEILGVRGLWNEALPDNLNTFNYLIVNEVNLGTMSLQEAALQTFTGKMANQRGFSTVNVIGTPLSDGTYRQVTVEFSN